MTDEALIAQGRAGKPRLFQQLVERHDQRVYGAVVAARRPQGAQLAALRQAAGLSWMRFVCQAIGTVPQSPWASLRGSSRSAATRRVVERVG